ITLVFLPTKSPKLNVIEVRWIWLQRKAIDNSTFRNQSDIGQAVQEWTENYNATHVRRISDILQIGVMSSVT
ncbi:MAG: transposase, partial [Candidatus Nitrosopolaris sp.]